MLDELRMWLAYKLGLMGKRGERLYVRYRRVLWLNRAYKRRLRRIESDRWYEAMDRVQKIRAIRNARERR